MPSPNATPTPITPPRVPLIDPRTGLIDRAWYLFFLSLNDAATAVVDDSGLTFSAESTIASLEAALRAVNQELQTLPPPIDLSDELIKQIQALGLVDCCSALVSQVAELQKQIEGLQMTPPPREFKRARYGSFYDSTTQTAAVINTAYGITFNTTDLSNGVYVGSPTSRIYVDESSLYDIQFSAQFDNTSGGDHLAWLWLRKNGTDVADSAGEMRLKGNNGELVASWNYFIELVEGDYVEIMWSTDNTAVQITARPAVAPVPAIPSIILTVSNNIKGVQ